MTVEKQKPFVPVFVISNDSAIQDVIDASRNLNAETARPGVNSERSAISRFSGINALDWSCPEKLQEGKENEPLP